MPKSKTTTYTANSADAALIQTFQCAAKKDGRALPWWVAADMARLANHFTGDCALHVFTCSPVGALFCFNLKRPDGACVSFSYTTLGMMHGIQSWSVTAGSGQWSVGHGRRRSRGRQHDTKDRWKAGMEGFGVYGAGTTAPAPPKPPMADREFHEMVQHIMFLFEIDAERISLMEQAKKRDRARHGEREAAQAKLVELAKAMRWPLNESNNVALESAFGALEIRVAGKGFFALFFGHNLALAASMQTIVDLVERLIPPANQLPKYQR